MRAVTDLSNPTVGLLMNTERRKIDGIFDGIVRIRITNLQYNQWLTSPANNRVGMIS